LHQLGHVHVGLGEFGPGCVFLCEFVFQTHFVSFLGFLGWRVLGFLGWLSFYFIPFLLTVVLHNVTPVHVTDKPLTVAAWGVGCGVADLTGTFDAALVFYRSLACADLGFLVLAADAD
jgi:hypothetical protein